MVNKENQETQYYIDLDLKTGRVMNWDYAQPSAFEKETFSEPFYHRIYITKVQYDKLAQKHDILEKSGLL